MSDNTPIDNISQNTAGLLSHLCFDNQPDVIELVPWCVSMPDCKTHPLLFAWLSGVETVSITARATTLNIALQNASDRVTNPPQWRH